MPSPLFPNFNNRRKQDQAAQNQANQSQSGGRGPIRLGGQIKNAITKSVMKSLGPLGSLIESLIRPFGKSLTTDIQKEIEVAEAITGHLKGIEPTPVPARPAIRIGSNPAVENDDWRLFDQEKGVLEGMLPVQSSNVYSIGFIHGPNDLLVRFLDDINGERVGPGVLYRYRSVPVSIWNSFKESHSAGRFVWDNLRTRGQIHGGPYSYTVEESSPSGYIPREIGYKRGSTAIYYIPRTVGGRKSTLPERQAKAGSMLRGWERRGSFNLRRS